MHLPEALATSTGADTGAFFFDVDGNGFLDFLRSRTGDDGSLFSRAFRQEGNNWVEAPNFAFPLLVSTSGERALVLQQFQTEQGSLGLLSYDTAEAVLDERIKFWSYEDDSWQSRWVNSPQPISATDFYESDVTCDGKPDLLAVDRSAGSIALVGIEEAPDGALTATELARVDLGEPISVSIADSGGCSRVITHAPASGRFLDISYELGTNFSASPIDTGDISSEQIDQIVVASLDPMLWEDLFIRLKSHPELEAVVLGYDLTTMSYGRSANYDWEISSATGPISSSYLPVAVDTSGDGSDDIILIGPTRVVQFDC